MKKKKYIQPEMVAEILGSNLPIMQMELGSGSAKEPGKDFAPKRRTKAF